MRLSVGARLGAYEVTGALGAGGMGEVYRARDTKLHREVALKVLPDLVAADPERVSRFEREAYLLASLNHPHIAQIYGLEEWAPDGGLHSARALVMELVDGVTLAERLRESGALSPTEALAVARQIADALEAAHEKGIIHRDLKPGNVMISASGQVKVLDFGLGKAIDAGPAGDASASPTMTLGATQAGMILGTAAYMSPEQAKGRAADRRSDVWAFGCVLYEMVTGRRAFDGDDVSETLASVLKGEPDWRVLPGDLPPAVHLVIERSLTKDRAARLPDISTAKFLLNEPSAIAPGQGAAGPSRSGRTIGLKAALTLIVMAAIAAAILARGVWPLSAPPETPAAGAAHFTIALPQADEVDPSVKPIALSPDGAHIVYAGVSGDGSARLYHRPLGRLEAVPIPGTDGATAPFFSPDGQWVGFFASGQLKKAPIGGGSVDMLADADVGRGGWWAEDGFIYYAPTNFSGLWKVHQDGGAPVEVTTLDTTQGEISHRWPQVLPGDPAVIFTIWKGPGPDEKFVGAQGLPSGARTTLVRGGDSGRYLPPGYLVYARGDDLFAVTLDVSTMAVGRAAPVRLPQQVHGEATEGANFAVSAAGTLIHTDGGASRLARRLTWVDAAGRTDPLPLPDRIYENVAIAPDGSRAVVQVVEGSVGLWIYDFARATMTRLVTSDGTSQAPVWTADGTRVVYRATRNSMRNLSWRAADGTGVEEPLTSKAGVIHTAYSASPDGRWIVFGEGGAGTRGLWMVSLEGAHEVMPIAAPGAAVAARISPNGGWLAYASEQSGQTEVYVQPFPGPGPRTQISRDGGTEPLWSRDGRRLFYVSGADRLMAVDVATSPAFSAEVPRLLYEGRFVFSPNSTTAYDISTDGRRFLRVQQVTPEQPVDRIQIVLNWRDELARLVR